MRKEAMIPPSSSVWRETFFMSEEVLKSERLRLSEKFWESPGDAA
jgi:hypothetical protein